MTHLETLVLDEHMAFEVRTINISRAKADENESFEPHINQQRNIEITDGLRVA